MIVAGLPGSSLNGFQSDRSGLLDPPVKGDPAWPVRCQAATGLGAIGDGDAIPQLYDALEDEAWWVRFNAASSLADLGLPGRAALAEATTADQERRRSVARYVLDRTASVPLSA